jgi:LysM repeat protein
MALPSTSAAQQQLEKLVEQNRQLQAQVDRLQETVKQWNAYYASQLAAARTNVTPTPDNAVRAPQTVHPIQPAQPVSPQTNSATATRAARVTSRTHTIVSGETAVGIARKSGITLDALQSANPGVNLSRIRAGQTLNLPPP